ncbi:MAG: VWA domain-containing protein [Bryobacteraceae bacterium]
MAAGFVLLLTSPAAYSAPADRRVAAFEDGRNLARVSGGPRDAGSTLSSGVPAPFVFPAVSRSTLFTGDNASLINVPPGSTRLVVQLFSDTPGVDMDLVVRYATDPQVPTGGGNVIAEFFSGTDTGNESVIIDLDGWQSATASRRATPTLAPGNYHIAIAVFTPGVEVRGRLVATITGGATPPTANLNKTWTWSANCQASGTFSGEFLLQQTGSALSGQFLGTANPGTITGTASGRTLAFARTFGARRQQWAGTVVSALGGGLSMEGTITELSPAIQCTFTARETAGGTPPPTGGGGGGATGDLRLSINQEDNSACPAQKKLFVTVTDSSNQPVPNLGQSNFSLSENGQPRTIAVQCNTSGSGGSSGSTVSVALLIDASGSLGTAGLNDEKAAARAFVDQLGAGDTIAVYSFATAVVERLAFTADKNAAKAAIDAIPGGGGTALYAAIQTGANALQARSGRKALVLMTDGRDGGTSPTVDVAIAAARQASAPVFAVGFGGINEVILTRIANETGGSFTRGATSADLAQILGSIGRALVSQCEITYTPADPTREADVEVTATAGASRGSTMRRVAACAAPAGGGGGGTCPGNVTLLRLDGGSLNASGAFVLNSRVWDTDASSSFWIVGVSQPSAGSPLLNPGATINLTPGSYFLYTHGGGFGTHVRITTGWSDGSSETTVFAVGDLTRALSWTRVSGSTRISLGSTGLALDLVGAGNTASSPNSVPDDVFRLDINCTGAGGGGTTPPGGGDGSGGGTTPPGNGGSTVDPGCDYFVRPLEYSFGPAGGTAGGSAPAGSTNNPPVLITTRPECRWGSISNDSWVTLEAGQSGLGSGAVSYRVAANTGPSARRGTITIAGRTHVVTQAAGTASCTYSISPNSATVPGSGRIGSVAVTASSTDCAWTAKSQTSWIALTAGGGGLGSGAVRYSVGRNPDPGSRTGAILIAGRTFTVTQTGAGTSGSPQVPENGVTPAGSGTPPSLPGGAVALGSFYTVFGVDIGPADPMQVSAFPLPNDLGGTRVELRQGQTVVATYIVFSSRTQINGIIPSNSPIGNVDLVVIYNGVESPPVRIRIVVNNFNIFTTSAGLRTRNHNQLRQPDRAAAQHRSITATRDQVVTIWGNGGGPINAPDNIAPPVGNLPFQFDVRIGGKDQEKLYYGRSSCCSALDQVIVRVSRDAPLGCNVPVQVRSGGAGAPWSNVATMAISADGGPCSDPMNPASTVTQSGGKTGLVTLFRANALAPIQPGQAPQSIQLDAGFAMFFETSTGGDLGFSNLTSLPPLGSCQSLTANQDLSPLLAGVVPGINTRNTGRQLDAGERTHAQTQRRHRAEAVDCPIRPPAHTEPYSVRRSRFPVFRRCRSSSIQDGFH